MNVLFVESNTSGTGAEFCRRAARRGLRPILLATEPQRYAFLSEADLAEVVQVHMCDTSKVEAVLAAARLWSAGGLAGVTTTSEYFVEIAAAAADALGLPGLSPATVRTCRNKGLLATFLTDHGVRVPRTFRVHSGEEAAEAARSLGLPVVVKPVAGSGSVGVRRADTAEQAAELVRQLLATPTNERGLPNPGEVLVQDFIQGPEYSVEAFGTTVVGVTRKHLGGPEGTFVETGHDFPVSGDEARSVAAATERALTALSFTFGPSHTELRVDDRGAVVIEINPRLAGGFIPHIVRHAIGVDLIDATLSAVTGASVDLSAHTLDPPRARCASIRFLIAPGDGVLARIDGWEAAAAAPGIVEVVRYRREGESVSVRGDFRDRIGHVLGVGDDLDAATEAACQGLARLAPSLAGQDGTGRIRAPIPDDVRRILFGDTVDGALPGLVDQLDVDRAHIVMLHEVGILAPAAGGALLREIDQLERTDFAGLRGRAAPRGAYLAYEQLLIERTGPDVGGMLTFARSRNDLQATVFALRLRGWLALTVASQLSLVAAVLRRARETLHVVMPAYTHGQPAVPSTLGHYLVGIASAAQRDTDGLAQVLPLLERCPMGAGAVGGTTAPIAPARVAALLGFARPLGNSFDAVASRDAGLRALAAAAVAGTTTSRFAQDLLLWLGEAEFLELPDHLVGSSSMMPQKRNPYFLEHVQGRAARPLGAFVAACTAVHAKPFTNSIAVGTEAIAELEATLCSHRESLLLLERIVDGFSPRADVMRARAEGAYVEATELATRLAMRPAVGFRAAHTLAGEAVSAAAASGRPLREVLGEALSARGWAPIEVAGPTDIVGRITHEGGPGIALAQIHRLEAWHAARLRDLAARRERWSSALERLRSAVRALTG